MDRRHARFDGKVALVTGGNSGIGRAVSLALAAEGAKVAIGCRDVEKGAAVAREIAAGGGTARVFRCDVASDDEVDAAVTAATAAFGPITVLVHSAGTEGARGSSAVTEVTSADWHEVVDVNLTGAYRCARSVLPAMAKAGGGAVVFIASIGGVEPLARAAPYVASKTGLVGLTKSIALDYAAHGVRANCVCPGVIETDMMKRAISTHENPHKLRLQLTSLHPLGRLGQPEDVAPAVLFLASDEARWSTGIILTVDGGFTLRRFPTAPPEL